MSENSIVLTEEKYKSFMRCLNIIKESCNDVDIRNGIVRQQGNDASSIIEIDMTEILDDLSFPLSALKQKIKLIEYFSDSIEITVSDGNDEEGPNIMFSDNYSKIKFMNPDVSYVDNKFITEESFEAMFQLVPEDVILEHRVPKIVADRIKISILNFNVFRISVDFNGETSKFFIRSQANDSADFLRDILTNRNIECKTSMMPTAFLVDNDDDIDLKMYNNPDTDVCIQKFGLTVDDLTVNIYTRSLLVPYDQNLPSVS